MLCSEPEAIHEPRLTFLTASVGVLKPEGRKQTNMTHCLPLFPDKDLLSPKTKQKTLFPLNQYAWNWKVHICCCSPGC